MSVKEVECVDVCDRYKLANEIIENISIIVVLIFAGIFMIYAIVSVVDNWRRC